MPQPICASFPDLSDAEHRRLLRRHFRALGRASLQETCVWRESRAEVTALTRFEGLEHLRPHLGKPLILFAPHFVGVTIGGVRVTAEFAPLVTLNAQIKNPYIHRLVFRSRGRFNQGWQGVGNSYPRQDGIKPVLRAIKKGLPFYYQPDLDFGRKDAVFTPLFGTPAATITGLSRVARVTVGRGCAVYYAPGRGNCRALYPAWENFPSDDVEGDTRRMNAFLEDRIREMPEQYFWVHKRFKTRPEGEASLYG